MISRYEDIHMMQTGLQGGYTYNGKENLGGRNLQVHYENTVSSMTLKVFMVS